MKRENLERQAKQQWDQYVNTLKEAFTWAKGVDGTQYFEAIGKTDDLLQKWTQKVQVETAALRNGLKKIRK